MGWKMLNEDCAKTEYIKFDVRKTALAGLYIGPNDEDIDFFDYITNKRKNIEDKIKLTEE